MSTSQELSDDDGSTAVVPPAGGWGDTVEAVLALLQGDPWTPPVDSWVPPHE